MRTLMLVAQFIILKVYMNIRWTKWAKLNCHESIFLTIIFVYGFKILVQRNSEPAKSDLSGSYIELIS